MEKEEILGIKVCNTTYEKLREYLTKDIKQNKKSFIVTVNPEKIVKANKDESLKKILNEAEYQIPDGIGIIYASKIKKGKIKSRITGIDTMEMLCDLSDKEGFKIFMYGGKERTVQLAKENIENKYKNINVCGYENGYEADEGFVLNKINNSNPDILFVALGSPNQEKFISRNMEKINCKILLGVGGSFDIISGEKKRAPKWMQRKGLEWFYRLIKEPKRIFRQLKLTAFIWDVIMERTYSKSKR